MLCFEGMYLVGLREKKTLGKCFDLIVLYGKKIVLGRTIVPMVHVFLWRGGAVGVWETDTIFMSTTKYTWQWLDHLCITLPLLKVYFPSLIMIEQNYRIEGNFILPSI